ncbi:hypothetical protein JB92DRAFT_1207464 [Gautieria morchelliformis]|nr:hypothetical protein JB92DRAFT_1207464 [Gautieria morchelliformis]
MPAIHSSPHPANDPSLHWDLNEDSMPGNPYPDTGGPGGYPPGYDSQQWSGGQSFAGREYHPASVPNPIQNQYPMQNPYLMQNISPTRSHASQFDKGSGNRRRSEREHDRMHGHSHHRHTNRTEDNRASHPWAGRQRAASFDDRTPHPMSRAQFERHFNEEEDEEDFEYDISDEGEPVFLPPKMGRTHAWDSSEEEEFEDEFDEDEELLDDEDEDDDSYAEEVRANTRQHGRGMMPRRGQPHRIHGNMRRSSPPPLETPPDSPPPLSRAMPSARGMDPRMMRGQGVDPRMMRGREVDPRMMRRGGMRIPVRARSHSRGRGIPIHPERVPRKRTRFVDDSSSSSGGGLAFQHGAARVRRSSSAGGGIKKAMRWLTGPNGE